MNRDEDTPWDRVITGLDRFTGAMTLRVGVAIGLVPITILVGLVAPLGLAPYLTLAAGVVSVACGGVALAGLARVARAAEPSEARTAAAIAVAAGTAGLAMEAYFVWQLVLVFLLHDRPDVAWLGTADLWLRGLEVVAWCALAAGLRAIATRFGDHRVAGRAIVVVPILVAASLIGRFGFDSSLGPDRDGFGIVIALVQVAGLLLLIRVARDTSEVIAHHQRMAEGEPLPGARVV